MPSEVMPRRFPPPWSIEESNNACFIVRDATKQALGHFYFESEPGRRSAANLLTKDEARRMASNFAKLPDVKRPKTPRTLPPYLTALDFLDRARRFRHAAHSFPDMDGPQPHWPKNFLVTHAVELVIKAFIALYEEPPLIHDLVELYEQAISLGLERDPGVATGLAQLNDLHESFYARYPHPEAKPVPMISSYDDVVDRLFADVTKALSATRA
jgi:hypothetical protein